METIDKHWGLFPDSLYPEDELLDPQSLQTDLRTHDHHELEVNFWDQEVRPSNPSLLIGSTGDEFSSLNSNYSSNSSRTSPLLSDDRSWTPIDANKAPEMLSRLRVAIVHPILPEPFGHLPFSPNSSVSRSEIATPINSPISPTFPSPLGPRTIPTTISKDVEDDVYRRSLKIFPASVNSTLLPISRNPSRPTSLRDRRRRQMHNESATRSRIRLNQTLDKMWDMIPVAHRRRSSDSEPGFGHSNGLEVYYQDERTDQNERIGRADKVEIAMDYILYLEERLKSMESQYPHSLH